MKRPFMRHMMDGSWDSCNYWWTILLPATIRSKEVSIWYNSRCFNKESHDFFAYTTTVPYSFAGMGHFVQYCSLDNDRPTLDWTALPSLVDDRIEYCTTEKHYIDWSDGRVVMALVSGSPEMSLLVRNRVGSNPTLIIILLFLLFNKNISCCM
jgi:hypothetical protein